MKTTAKRIFCLLLALLMLLCSGCYVSINDEKQYYVYFYDQNGELEDLKEKHNSWLEKLDYMLNGTEESSRSNPMDNHFGVNIELPQVWLHDVDVVEYAGESYVFEHHFMGWSRTCGSDVVDYYAGDNFTSYEDVNLYSVYSNDPDAHADALELDKDTMTIRCKECGARNPHVTINTFSKLYTFFSLDYNSKLNFSRKDILYSYMVYLGADANVVAYLSQFDADSKDFKNMLNLQEQGIDGEAAFGKAVGSLKTAGDIALDRSVQIHGEYYESPITQDWTTTAGVLSFLNSTVTVAGIVQQADTLLDKTDVSEAKAFEMVEAIQTCTSYLGSSNMYYATSLNILADTMEYFFDRYHKREYMFDYYGEALFSEIGETTVMGEVNENSDHNRGSWSLLAHVDTWEYGPDLDEIAKYYDDLSPKSQELIQEYIEFRVNYEFQEYLKLEDVTLEDYATYLVAPSENKFR